MVKQAAQFAIVLLCIAFSGLAAYNVFADNAEVTALAKGAACAPDASAACKAEMTQNGRSPFGQTFVFASGKANVAVSCRRAFLVVGAYTCTKSP